MNKRVGVCIVGVVACALAGSSTAYAADVDIPIDTVIVSGVAEGNDVELASVASAGFAGQSCTVRAVRDGEGPVHEGNDLSISSGDDTVVLANVEREPAATTDGSDAITLGDVITIELTMGSDEAFAGDIVVEFDCEVAVASASAASGTPRDRSLG